jgi:SanA protein
MKRTGIIPVITIAAFLVLTPPISTQQAKKQIKTIETVDAHSVAIVFGAGIVGDYPSDVLEDRLITAAELYNASKIEHILVSGDNRYENYSEPDVMTTYLSETLNIPSEDIYQDYAGRRTYDTCVRANELWGINQAILVTQDFHLPRAIWTCNQLGINTVGISASRQAYKDAERNTLREWLASYKSFIDIYLWNPPYVSGAFEIDLN